MCCFCFFLVLFWILSAATSSLSPIFIFCSVQSVWVLFIFYMSQLNALNFHHVKYTYIDIPCVLLYCALHGMCFVLLESLWQLFLEQVCWHHFSKSICSHHISVSHFANFNNTLNFLITIICYGDQWPLMLLFIIVVGCHELCLDKTANLVSVLSVLTVPSTDQLFPHLSAPPWDFLFLRHNSIEIRPINNPTMASLSVRVKELGVSHFKSKTWND